MKRRDFLVRSSSAAALAAVSLRAPFAFAGEAGKAEGWRTFDVVTSVDLAGAEGATQLWLPVPLAQAGDWQRRIAIDFDAPGARSARLVTQPGYGVEMLHVSWPDAQSVGHVELTSRVATRDRSVDLESRVRGDRDADLKTYLHATALLPTDGLVKSTAERIVAGQRGDVDKAHALYEWVVDNTYRDAKVRGCGVGDINAMLANGTMGGKCADINALYVALARSIGIPARDAYGVRVTTSKLGYNCLGKLGDISKAQHCRAEFYAQGRGWIPVDPADVRKVILEEDGGMPMENPKVQAARRRLFGSWEMNWIAYNMGHDVALPGSGKKAVPFLMYPQGETNGARLDSLDPAVFKYSIRSGEVG
jgi:transglutaminase-like putative cysteine protease